MDVPLHPNNVGLFFPLQRDLIATLALLFVFFSLLLFSSNIIQNYIDVNVTCVV